MIWYGCVLARELHGTSSLTSVVELEMPSITTSSIVLFPGSLAAVPPKTFSRTLLSKEPSRTKPAVYSMRGRNVYPYSPLSPLVLSRENPLWCTERFFPDVSRSADWQECLWQMWLETFGEIDARPTTDWIGDGTVGGPTNNRANKVNKSAIIYD